MESPRGTICFLRFFSLHKLTDNVTQPAREKNPEHSAHMSKDSLQPDFLSSQSGKPYMHIGGGSPRHLASPTPLQVFTGISAQLRDTDFPKQQFSGRTTLVAPERSRCQRQYHQPSSPRLVHHFRRIQGRLGCMLPGLNCKR